MFLVWNIILLWLNVSLICHITSQMSTWMKVHQTTSSKSKAYLSTRATNSISIWSTAAWIIISTYLKYEALICWLLKNQQKLEIVWLIDWLIDWFVTSVSLFQTFLHVVWHNIRRFWDFCIAIPKIHPLPHHHHPTSPAFRYFDKEAVLYSDVITDTMASQITRLFTETFIQAQIKGNIKYPRHWPLLVIHRWPVNSLHKGPVTRKVFPFDDVIMSLAPCPLPQPRAFCLLRYSLIANSLINS